MNIFIAGIASTWPPVMSDCQQKKCAFFERKHDVPCLIRLKGSVFIQHERAYSFEVVCMKLSEFTQVPCPAKHGVPGVADDITLAWLECGREWAQAN